MNEKTIDRIDQAISKDRFLKVVIEVEGEEDRFIGIPIRRSRTLLALHRITDFHFDGYSIIRLKDIVEIQRSRQVVTQERILKFTGEIQNFDNPSWIRIGSWKSLFSLLKQREICACVSSVSTEMDVFGVGTVTTVGNKSVVLKGFDANGVWIEPKDEFQYSEIKEVFFGDEYSTVFHRFITNRNPKGH